MRRQVISMTPLIDVVFILLVFFMLASSFTTWRSVEMDMATPGGGVAEGRSVLVELRTDGLRFGGRNTDETELIRQLQDQLADDAELRVLVRFDHDLPLQDSVQLVNRLSTAGIRNLRVLPSREAAQ